MPYIPGGDVCGIVVETPHDDDDDDADGNDANPPFQRGDMVVAQFHQNWGGLAEYAVVKTNQCFRVTEEVSL